MTSWYANLIHTARDLASQVDEWAAIADEFTSLHPQTRDALKQSGLVQHAVPAEFGGASARIDPLALVLIREVLMGTSAHLDTMFAMQGLGSYPLAVSGNDAVRAEWLPRVAALEAIPALALTEPEVGSDLRGITTRIFERSDGQLVINGQKSFITNAGAADFYCVLAREEDLYSMVFVPAKAPGVVVRSGHPLIAPHVMGEVDFNEVAVPPHHRIGLPGEGFPVMLQTLAVFRVTVAGAAVGLATAALQEARSHTLSRTQFGKPLAKIGAVGQILARGWADTEAARAMTYRAAKQAAADPLAALHLTSIAKVVATETAGEVVDSAVQLMGRFGLVSGSKIERLYRNARPLRIYEGSTEVLLDALARQLGKSEDLLKAGVLP